MARDARQQEMTIKTTSRCNCETRQSAQVPLGGLVEWKTHEARLDSKLGICGTVQGVFFCLILRAADDCSLFTCLMHITAALE